MYIRSIILLATRVNPDVGVNEYGTRLNFVVLYCLLALALMILYPVHLLTSLIYTFSAMGIVTSFAHCSG